MLSASASSCCVRQSRQGCGSREKIGTGSRWPWTTSRGIHKRFRPPARACPSIFSRLPEPRIAHGHMHRHTVRRRRLPRGSRSPSGACRGPPNQRPPQVQEREQQPLDRAKLLRYWGLNSDHGKGVTSVMGSVPVLSVLAVQLLAGKMTPTQIAEAHRLASAWKPE
jgi:hypothetical protein